MENLWIWVVGIIVAYILYVYNALVTGRNQIKESVAGVDVQLKKRYELIPNLVATVKGYMEHESSTFEKIAELRNLGMNSDIGIREKIKLDNELKGMVGSIMMQAESYPDLKASENFMHLQRTLNEVEEQISAARRFFNSAVQSFNNICMMFPSNVIAKIFGFQPEKFFEINDNERENVSLGDSFNK